MIFTVMFTLEYQTPIEGGGSNSISHYSLILKSDKKRNKVYIDSKETSI